MQFGPERDLQVARLNGFIGFGEIVDDTDTFRFETSESGRVIIDARTRSGALNPALRVFNSAGELVAANDDSENSNLTNPRDAQILLRNLAADEYFVSVGASDLSTGKYTVAVRSNAQIESGSEDAGGSFDNARRINLNPFSSTTVIRSSIEHGSDSDFYRFVSTSTGELVVRSAALSGNLNTVLRVFNAAGNVIASNNNFRDTLDSRVKLNIESGESYSLSLTSVRSTAGDYRIVLKLPQNESGPFSSPSLGASEAAAANAGLPGADGSSTGSELTRFFA